MKLSDYVQSKPISTIATVKKILGCNASYASLALHRLVARGILQKVSRNKYTSSNDIYTIATNLYTPSYISFWSASQYYGYTEQILSTIQIVTTKPHKDVHFERYTFKFVVLPKKYFFGYSKIQTAKGSLFIAEKEKLLLDAFLKPKEMGNFDEILKVFKQADVQKDVVVNMLKNAKNNSLTKRVGFILEQQKHIDISSDVTFKDKNYVSFNNTILKNKNTKESASKWRVKI